MNRAQKLLNKITEVEKAQSIDDLMPALTSEDKAALKWIRKTYPKVDTVVGNNLEYLVVDARLTDIDSLIDAYDDGTITDELIEVYDFIWNQPQNGGAL